MARPTSAARNLTMTDTSVALASGQISRKVVGMATIAISSGTIAIHEAKTKARTSRAPTPATRPSTARLAPPAFSPSAAASRRRIEAGGVDRGARDGDAGQRLAAQRAPRPARGRRRRVPGSRPARRSCGRRGTRSRGRASRRRTRRGRRAARPRRGQRGVQLAARRRASRPSCPVAASRPARSVRRRPRCRRSGRCGRWRLKASLPGMSNEVDRASPAGFIAANPAIARTIQSPTTSFL